MINRAFSELSKCEKHVMLSAIEASGEEENKIDSLFCSLYLLRPKHQKHK